MMPQDDEPTSGPEPPSKPSRTEEARRIVEEYADDLREILKKLRNQVSDSSIKRQLNDLIEAQDTSRERAIADFRSWWTADPAKTLRNELAP